MSDVEAVLGVLRQAGIDTSAEATRAAPGTTEQVRQAIDGGCDTILACGGDGTVHDVLQGMVNTNAALGIIPLGTANALAHDLRIPLAPDAAAGAALHAKPRRISVGRVEYCDFLGQPAARYFTVAAGVGVDAHLFYELNPIAKNRMGMAAYYAKATHLWLAHPLENFGVEFADGAPQQVTVSQLLAVRIRNFGGVLRELAPGAALERDDFRLVLFRTRSRLAYLRYILRGWLAKPWSIAGIELFHSKSVTCRRLAQAGDAAESRIFVEADGELLGTIPAKISVIADAFTLLVP